MNKKNFYIAVVLFLVSASIWFLVKKFESHAPVVIQNQKIEFLNKKRTLDFRVEDLETGLRSITVIIVQNKFQKEIYTEEFKGNILLGKGDTNYKDIQIDFDPVEMKLKEGSLALIIKVNDYSWRKRFTGNVTVFKQIFTIDRTPPSLTCLSTQHYINQGGTGLVVYQTTDDSVKNGAYVGDIFFSGFPVTAPTSKNLYIAYFAIPYNKKEPRIELMSQDKAGNESRAGFYYSIRKKAFRRDSITISDKFLQRKMPQFFSFDETLPGKPLIECFLKINNQLRQENNQKILEICRHPAPEALWEGRFLRLPNAKTSALFADQRAYFYKGKKIDQQVHLGIDLASIAHAQVPATNNGIVIFAGELGIYGKTIIIDHGQNIFSMYSHLSTFNITQDQKINKGDIIGTSGDTGLAGGDHLHFAMLVGEVFVNPIEWWDKHWIDDNIILKLNLIK